MRISGKVLDRVLCLTGPNADDVTATRWRCWEEVALAAAVARDDPAEEAVESSSPPSADFVTNDEDEGEESSRCGRRRESMAAERMSRPLAPSQPWLLVCIRVVIRFLIGKPIA